MTGLSSLFKSTKRAFLPGFLAGTVGVSVFFINACGSKNDAINQAEKRDAINGVPAPSLAGTKTIAQEGFIFGLPIVMYYTSANKSSTRPRRFRR
jgi:hypothetical protein